MSGNGPRAAWIAGLLATSVATSILAGPQAHAVVGDEAKDGQYQFTAKIDIGDGKRACTGALVESQWVLTAASCFADDPSTGFRITGGTPKMKTSVTVGRTDLSGTDGTTVGAVELVPRGDRDLVMVKLAKPVAGVTPVPVATSEPRQGEDLRAAGYGRTKDEWTPDRLHSTDFNVSAISGASLDLAGKSADAALCKGDTGSPAFREKGGKAELAAINSTFWQAGCWGTDESETRRNATSTRVDDIADWIQTIGARDLLSRKDWKNAAYTASGYFTGRSDGKRYMDLFVIWKDGSASLYQGSMGSDPKTPFSAEYQIAGANSTWKYARAITGGDFAGDGRDGLFVRWTDGEVTEYAHLDEKGAHGEKTLQKGAKNNPNPFWKNARLVTAGKFTGNSQRDDVLVVWENGSTAMYTDIHSKGLSGHVQLTEASKSWDGAVQISTGDFTGKTTSDLLVQWQNGETRIYSGVDTKGYHGHTKLREAGSPWKNARTLTTGSFANNAHKINDILISWANGNLGVYPGANGDGTHGGIELVS
ncbi:S1 family peptidase [Streptomyces huiliensis]|uniref:S1 family peptidase n=1 Tax=Streptomyces huiliensis TaxID=2876027 RepID=UPI001CBAAC9F|nr:S1 family peptidase [Streptomyces huiliensis]MBZ4318660.1 S1 family peptidase [Streptomyces huiliensis]